MIGLDLYRIFQGAGLPAPTLRLDAALAGGPDTRAYEMLPEIVRSLLPAMERFRIAAAAEIEIESLSRWIRKEISANHGIVIGPLLIGAWACKHEITTTEEQNGGTICL